MNHNDKIVKDAIEKRLETIRAVAADSKAEQVEITAIQDWQAVPANVTDAQIAIVLVIAQSNPAAINANVLQALGEKLNEMAQKDKPRLDAILKAADAFSRKPRLQPGMSMEVITAPIAENSRTHAVIATLVEIDADFNVTVPESIEVDLCMALYVTPRAEQNLSETFNLPMNFTKAGAKLAPVVVTYDAAQDGVKHVHINGYTGRDGQVQPLSMVVPVEMPEKKPEAAPSAPQP